MQNDAHNKLAVGLLCSRIINSTAMGNGAIVFRQFCTNTKTLSTLSCKVQYKV